MGGWGTLAQRTSPTCQAGLNPAWWVGGAREHFAYSLCDVRGAVNNGIFLNTGVLSSSGPSDLTLFPKDSCGAASCIEYEYAFVPFCQIYLPAIVTIVTRMTWTAFALLAMFLPRSYFCHACNTASRAILMFVSFCKHFHHSV